MIKREESRHDFAFMAGVVIGAAAGAVATLALAPRAGTETRDRWRARMDEMPIDDLRSRAATLKEAAASQRERLREAASGAAASGVLESTKARVTELVDRSPLPVTLGANGEAETSSDASETLAEAAEQAEDRLAAAAADEAEREDESASDAVAGFAAEAPGPESSDADKPQT
jgi:gas vesicle protein